MDDVAAMAAFVARCYMIEVKQMKRRFTGTASPVVVYDFKVRMYLFAPFAIGVCS
jgi:hypothetical protein